MIRAVLFASCLLLPGAFAFAFQQAEQGAIRGIVTQAGTDQPIAGAQVVLSTGPVALVPGTPGIVPGQVPAISGAGAAGVVFGGGMIAGGTAVSPPPAPQGLQPGTAGTTTVTTDRSGRFSFTGLRAGAYRVMASAPGYVQQEYGQRVFNAPGSPIVLTAAAELATDITLALARTGTISGQILDESGQLAMAVPVQVLRVMYAPTGERRVQAVGAGQSDDRGQYRVFGLTPGRYYLSAGNSPGPLRAGLMGGPIATPNPGLVYGLTYYPGVPDLTRAAMLEVPAGGEIVSDMVVTRSQLYRVRGRVIGGATGEPPARVSVSLGYTNLSGGSGSFSSGLRFDSTTGDFELQNVIPGDYMLSAQSQLPQTAPPDPATIQSRALAMASRPAAQAPVRVVNADVEGIVLTLTPPLDVSGRIRSQRESVIPGVERIRVQLRTVSGGNSPRPPQDTGPDGSFVIQGVRPGDYTASVLGTPAGFYLEGLRYAGADILGKTFTVSASRYGTLDLVLGSGAQQVQGSVTSDGLRAVPGAQAVLVPAQRDRFDLYRNAMTDQNGRFTISDVAPGSYDLFAWEALEPYSYFDPAVLERYDALGAPVSVGLGAATVDVRVIPAD